MSLRSPHRVAQAVLSAALMGAMLAPSTSAQVPLPGKLAQKPTLSITGGGVLLVISTATPAQDPDPVIDESAQLKWKKSLEASKITVSNDCVGQSFILTVEATNVQNGVSAGPVNLTHMMLDTDFVVGIQANQQGKATLRYTASAPAALGNSDAYGDDDHFVTYTITAD